MIFFKQKKEYRNSRGGYTLVELIVAIGLFVIVALISSSAFLGVVSSNRQALATRTAMDNLDSAVESMSRAVQTGFSYRCESTGALTGPINVPQDCPNGGGYLAFEGQKGNPLASTDQVIYRLGPAGSYCTASQICASFDGGTTYFALTSPELSIQGLAFRVYGAPKDDGVGGAKQPRIVIVIIGSAGSGATQAAFDVQTTISQRLPDFP